MIGTGSTVRGSAAIALVGCAITTACADRGPNAEALDRETRLEILTLRNVGLAQLEEERPTDAAESFGRLSTLWPGDALPLSNLGVARLRAGLEADALESLDGAVQADPANPVAWFNLAAGLESAGRGAEAIEALREALVVDSSHVRSLYRLADLYGASTQAGVRTAARRDVLRRLVAVAPGLVPARFDLVELLLVIGDADAALPEWEMLFQLIPKLPDEAVESYRTALGAMRADDAEAALVPAITVHNQSRVQPFYQTGIRALRGPTPAPGMPLLQFTHDPRGEAGAIEAGAIDVRFVETGDGLPGPGQPLAIADLDGDGGLDVVAGHAVYRRTGDEWSIVWTIPGDPRTLNGVAPGDFDNDGRMDLFILRDGPASLYRALADGTFEDVTGQAGAGVDRATSAVFVDLDHDGDLDLFVGREGTDRVLRNNLDGTFTDRTAATGLGGDPILTRAVAFGDFDHDEAIDLVVSRDDGVTVYLNHRQETFDAVGTGVGTAQSIDVADADQDGWLDLLLALDGPAGYALVRNLSSGRFEPAPSEGTQVTGSAARFLDFDNDGYLDIAVTGLTTDNGTARLALYRGRPAEPGSYVEVTTSLPSQRAGASEEPATGLLAADVYGDGDVDLLVLSQTETRLLRNDGGNLNPWLAVRLVGLGPGSGKVNHFGIGSAVQVATGDHVQTRVASAPLTHFGLGRSELADVVRVQWTNGVPQNDLQPRANRVLVEEQVLKGSCGFLYTWNGERFEFVTDVFWKSAIGMPLGILAGEVAWAPPDPSREYVRIPPGTFVVREGRYELKLTEELWEVAYLDKLRLVAVDHPADSRIYVNEPFVPPQITDWSMVLVDEERAPASATDGYGRDVLDQVLDADHVYVSDLGLPGPYQGTMEMHDLVLDPGDLGELAPDDSLRLILQGWIFPTDASINVALGQTDTRGTVFPFVQVRDRNGEWVTAIENISFPSGKNKTMVIDLAGLFMSDDHRVRIRTNMQVYWDRAFFSTRSRRFAGTTDPEGETEAIKASGLPIGWTVLAPGAADLKWRGFSRPYRKGGRYGPHWFDYSETSDASPWRELEGTYTRYGDVLDLLDSTDNRYIVFGPGDEISVSFDAAPLPDLAGGWSRTFLLYSDAFLKDADLNTAGGQTVGPLPFHGMNTYPYSADESYPGDQISREFLETYMTREVEIRSPATP